MLLETRARERHIPHQALVSEDEGHDVFLQIGRIESAASAHLGHGHRRIHAHLPFALALGELGHRGVRVQHQDHRVRCDADEESPLERARPVVDRLWGTLGQHALA